MTSSSMTYVPPQAFVQAVRVRSYEGGRDGAIGMGTVLRYLESLATEASAAAGFDNAWYEQRNVAWVVREMTVLLGARPGIGAELMLATWVSAFRRVQAQREYAIWRPGEGHLVARASARWAYVDREIGQPVRVHDGILAQVPVPGHRMPVRQLAELEPAAKSAHRTELPLTVRTYETDTRQHVNNCVYADWLGEGLHGLLRAQQPALRPEHLAPRYYHIEYLRSVRAGDAVQVATHAVPRGDRGLSVQQDITDTADGGVRVRARSEHLRLRDRSPSRPQ